MLGWYPPFPRAIRYMERLKNASWKTKWEPQGDCSSPQPLGLSKKMLVDRDSDTRPCQITDTQTYEPLQILLRKFYKLMCQRLNTAQKSN
jgi:hypothetical protein